ncbi:MAG: septum formation initiator [Opitutus sp.]|nr:septum formation initiator [Opitutus sp.]
MNWNKVITVGFIVLFLGVGGYAGVFFLEMNRELTQLRAQERGYQRKLAEAQAKLDAQEKYLRQLRSDPQVVEQVIRKKLGYVRAQEFVFRFEDPNRSP